MPQIAHHTYLSADKQTQIHAMTWKPDGEVKAVLQIVHGMQEYIERYDDFARACCEQGIFVAANDHLGHGASILSEAQFGYFAEKSGNRAVLQDMRTLQKKVRSLYPDVPYILLGHSMGSFLARQYLCLYGKDLDGAIISGTAYHPKAETIMGMTLCSLMAKRKGWEYRSPFLTNMAMGSYNKKFEPVRTPVDWLTRDEKIVDAYRADKRTQFLFTVNGFYMLFSSLRYLTVQDNVRRMPKDLPVLFIAGEMDPVGNYGDGVKRVAAQFIRLGMKDVTCRLYPNDRHEVLNELNKQEVYDEVFAWIREKVTLS